MGAAPRTVASGLRFPEGPTLLDDGALAVVEMQGEAVARVAPDGGTSPLGDLGGGPNGSALGSDGAVYVANNGGLSLGESGLWKAAREFDGCVQRVDPEGSAAVVADDLPGPAPHRPNDLCFAPDGRLLVTDSANWENPRELGPGRLLAIGPDGAVEVLLELEGIPNGLGFGPGGNVLYLAQSMTRRILAIDFRDGAPGDPGTYVELPSGMPDGLCIAQQGKMYVCGSVDDCVHVFEDGDLSETLAMPPESQPTNCCLNADGELLVTLGKAGSLVALDVGEEPLPLYRGSIMKETSA